MGCYFKHENCVDGWIYNPDTNSFTGKCECAIKYSQIKSFIDSTAKKENVVSLDEMNNVKIYNPKKGFEEFIYSKELFGQIKNVLPSLIQKSSRLYLSGIPGSGKTTFATTLLYYAALDGFKTAFISADDFEEAVFNYQDKSDLKAIYKRIEGKDILVIDDLGSELSSDSEIYLEKLTKEYNKLIRKFTGLVVITANTSAQDTVITYNNDERLFSVLFKENNMREYMFDVKDLRQEEQNDDLSELF
jgi:DNA replication protein DnaC